MKANPIRHPSRREDGYRSALEAKVAAVLEAEGVNYLYEQSLTCSDGKRYYPDFKLPDGTLLEVSGYAYDSWQEMFQDKVKRLVDDGYAVVCVTYPAMAGKARADLGIRVLTVTELGTWLRSLDA